MLATLATDLHWTESALRSLDVGLIALGGAWLVAEGVRAAHRRAYNLTKVESAKQDGLQPSFTKVDHEARQAALERGDAYAKERAASEAGPLAEKAKRLPPWGRIVRMASKIVAAGIVALVPPTASGMAAREGVKVDVLGVASRYPMGVGLAIVVLVISLVQLVRGTSKS